LDAFGLVELEDRLVELPHLVDEQAIDVESSAPSDPEAKEIVGVPEWGFGEGMSFHKRITPWGSSSSSLGNPTSP
jgi:hypothetical protein